MQQVHMKGGDQLMADAYVMDLVKMARKSGGDKYSTPDESLVIYVPQFISRPKGGNPPAQVKVSFEVVE